ncbi:general stress protein [Paenibacillus sp. 32O-W]|uniref:General stress protein n=1 Tax=Paenibacillus cisolokensis TaxID=1658519 RepID=A0ABQ4N7U6_9BACL|nr:MULTISPECIES: YtxH domain-containing protein [Paenibacillus]ALS29014.1 general stress protein [Paenibacillus sp. 32O-W]GIQ64314.1 hypothetical protein PACILC2_28820 [Paenibacillus cisolokensis]
MAKRNQSKSFWIGALAGSLVGSVTALLLAPKSGKELRKDIAEGGRAVGETSSRIVGQVCETTGRISRQVSGQTAQLTNKAKQTASQVISQVKSWRGEGVVSTSNVPASALTETADELTEASDELTEASDELTAVPAEEELRETLDKAEREQNKEL